jgi:phosphohistidine phosphatase
VTFFLVRHGRAEPAHPDGDAARRLTAEGLAHFAAHARALASTLQVSSVRTSPFVRARQTADLLGVATGAPVVEEPALAAGASSGAEVLRLGALLGPGVALVGHNPELAEAIASIAGAHLEVPPGAIAAVEVERGRFRLAWLQAPR